MRWLCYLLLFLFSLPSNALVTVVFIDHVPDELERVWFKAHGAQELIVLFATSGVIWSPSLQFFLMHVQPSAPKEQVSLCWLWGGLKHFWEWIWRNTSCSFKMKNMVHIISLYTALNLIPVFKMKSLVPWVEFAPNSILSLPKEKHSENVCVKFCLKSFPAKNGNEQIYSFL